ncbi:hypothetical protein I316_04050 [Kwoniella heveanensis BCC8398]|uniref:Uncharacterized protein n=1 Tax=Kwoniella heveanensis BCC8398 TaxID=1296120 RepID=A0A1B9GSW6_9TREE|nr:hypothetical protein I316_04050 [Kwoniella heveanensis BCC8398]
MSGLAIPSGSGSGSNSNAAAGPSSSGSALRDDEKLDGEGEVLKRAPQKVTSSVPEITAVQGLVPTLQ